jgi:hypothetical protein
MKNFSLNRENEILPHLELFYQPYYLALIRTSIILSKVISCIIVIWSILICLFFDIPSSRISLDESANDEECIALS